MKVLIVGSDQHWAIENWYVRYLSDKFVVRLFPASRLFDEYYRKSLTNKILFRLGISWILEEINQQLLTKVETEQPDIIWVFKGMEIFPKTLKILKRRGCFLVNYNPDHPFIISSRGSGNYNVKASVGIYDRHFCYSRELMHNIKKTYGIGSVFLPFGFHLDESTYQQIEGTENRLKACFIGNPDRIRSKFLRQLADEGIPVDVYGHNWEKLLQSNNTLRLFPAVFAEQYWKTLRSYRVQLNIFRPHNAGSHNMRTFEVPAAGGIMVAPDTPEHREFFHDGEEAFFYNNFGEALEKCRHLLTLSSKEAGIIRQQARKRSVNSGYSYSDRTAIVVDTFNSL